MQQGSPAEGVMVMRIDLSEFLEEYEEGAFWVNGSGDYLRGCRKQSQTTETEMGGITGDGSDCRAFDEFPGLQSEGPNRDPLILRNSAGEKIAWLPLVFTEKAEAVMWVGRPVDESAIASWKFSLMVNVVAVLFFMFILIYLAANRIAARIDRMRNDLVGGLDMLMNKERRVSFDWQGPKEINDLSADLSSMADRYITTSEARTKAEAALRESEDKFRSLTASALDAIILMDYAGNIAYWNEAASLMFGYSSAEALGAPIHSLIEPRREDEAEIVIDISQPKKGRLGQTVEMFARTRHGHEIPVELSLSSTKINEQWHAIWIVRDTSERKRTEQESRKQQQQLLEADKMISLGLLVSGVAHEINNPNSIALLNLPILGRAWESVKPILDEYYEEYGDFSVAGIEYTTMRQQLPRLCGELEESASRIKEIVVELKDYARQESSGITTPVDINEVVRSGVRLTSNSVRRVTTDFDAFFAENLPEVRGNKQRLIQVIINLIQNSCEALEGRQGGVRVRTLFNGETDGVEVIVEDDGIGIPADMINKVTDPFFTTKRTMGGTGLGLAVSAGIVKEHNGLMDFQSVENKGTKVTVSLPAWHGKEQNT
jgi:PAS domain S-box-containing protein